VSSQIVLVDYIYDLESHASGSVGMHGSPNVLVDEL
jgi:hypothetical protein